MPPPSQLAIKSGSTLRLIKEEASYHKELVDAKKRLEKMESEGADEYEIRQQKKVVEETEVMPKQVRIRLAKAVEDLKAALEAAPESEPEANKEKAEKALADAQKVLDEHAEADAK